MSHSTREALEMVMVFFLGALAGLLAVLAFLLGLLEAWKAMKGSP